MPDQHPRVPHSATPLVRLWGVRGSLRRNGSAEFGKADDRLHVKHARAKHIARSRRDSHSFWEEDGHFAAGRWAGARRRVLRFTRNCKCQRATALEQWSGDRRLIRGRTRVATLISLDVEVATHGPFADPNGLRRPEECRKTIHRLLHPNGLRFDFFLRRQPIHHFAAHRGVRGEHV